METDIPGMEEVFFININTWGLVQRSTDGKALYKQWVLPGVVVHTQGCQVAPAIICTHPEGTVKAYCHTLQLLKVLAMNITNPHKLPTKYVGVQEG